ncbi:MAG: hypothetical protein U0W24_12700 [Bacteroidales bacterium]
MKKLLSFLAGFCLPVLSLSAQSVYDVFTYKEPAGYTKNETKVYRSYTKTDNSKGTYCVISLYSAAQNDNVPAEAFKKEWKEIVATPYSIKTDPVAETMSENNGWKAFKASSTFNFSGSVCSVSFYSFLKDGKAADIVVLTNGTEYKGDISALLASLKVGTNHNPSVNTTNNNQPVNSEPGSITGIWLYYGLDYNTQMSWQEMVFFGDGSSIDLIPRNGLFNYSLKNEKNSFAHIGTYSFSNGKGFNQLTPAIKETMTMIKPGELKIESRIYNKSVLINGQKFNGTYTSYADPDDPHLQTLPYGQKPVIHFHADGRFEDEGLFATFLQSYGKYNDAAGNGTYELKNYSVVLKYSDGRTRQEAFYTVFANNLESANIIFISKGKLNKMK